MSLNSHLIKEVKLIYFLNSPNFKSRVWTIFLINKPNPKMSEIDMSASSCSHSITVGHGILPNDIIVISSFGWIVFVEQSKDKQYYQHRTRRCVVFLICQLRWVLMHDNQRRHLRHQLLRFFSSHFSSLKMLELNFWLGVRFFSTRNKFHVNLHPIGR